MLCFLLFPQEFYNYIKRLIIIFNLKFVSIVFVVYGITQGFGEGWYYLFQRYFFKDILLLTPSQSQLMAAVARTPWNIKPIYGILADCFPIFGYHRTYYITLAGIIGTLSWISLSYFDLSLPLIVLAMLLGNHSTASPDVIIDACVAEKSNIYPIMAADLQSLCSGSLALCGIISTLTSGPIIHTFGSNDSFLFLSFTSFVLIFPSLLGWLGEDKVQYYYYHHDDQNSQNSQNNHSKTNNHNNNNNHNKYSNLQLQSDLELQNLSKDEKKQSHNNDNDNDDNNLHLESIEFPSTECSTNNPARILQFPPLFSCFSSQPSYSPISPSSSLRSLSCFITTEILSTHRNLNQLAIIVTIIALSISSLVIFHHHNHPLIITSIIIAIVLIPFVLYFHLSSISITLRNVAIFIFLRASLQIDTDQAFFYWYTESPDGPQFHIHFVSLITTTSFITMFIAVIIYNRYFSTYTYQNMFIYAQLLTVFTALLDVVLIKRWNLALGISDKLFIIGDSVVSPLVKRFILIPTCILASRLCPTGGEATFFALLMSLGNFGTDIASYTGAILTDKFAIGHPNYDYLPHLMVCKSISRLLTILLIPLLVPEGSPIDSSDYLSDKKSEVRDNSIDVSLRSTTSNDDNIYKSSLNQQKQNQIQKQIQKQNQSKENSHIPVSALIDSRMLME